MDATELVERVRSVRAMGSDCILRAVGPEDPAGALDRAVDRLEDLERRWTRFDASSELSAVNAANGSSVVVSDATLDVVDAAIEAWHATEGLFDPTLFDAIVAAGYDATFESLADRAPMAIAGASTPRIPVAGSILVDRSAGTITVPAGVHLDLGGIGKGRAADLLVAGLLGDGAVGACVDLGGDVRVAGRPVEGRGWGVAIDDPFRPGRDLAVVALSDGAVATSSRLRRRWATVAGEAHHLIDPITGRPAETDLVAVTVVAASAAWAEVHAKAVLVGGSVDGIALLADAGLAGLCVTADGDVLRIGAIGDFLVDDEVGGSAR